MKKIYLLAAFAGALLISTSCSNSKDTQTEETHTHAEGETHDHDHAHEHGHEEGDDHSHTHEAGEAHEHEHDHDHEHGEGEVHDHSHGEEAHDHNHEGHGDEITLAPAKAKAAGVQVEEMKPGTFQQVIRTSGEVLAAQGDEETVAATTSGIVSFPSTLVEGKAVARGANLAVISAKNLADGEPAEQARIAYEAAKNEYDRASKLTASGIVSQKEFDVIKQNYEKARLSYEALSGHATKNGQRVTASIGGYVKSCLVKAGDYVNVGQPLLTITQNRRLFLRAEVSERYYKYLRSITSANFVTSYDDRVYSLKELNGRILSYGKSTDKTAYCLPVTFEFDNKGDVVPGSFVEIYLLSGEMQNVLSVPKTALTEEQGLYFVYLQVAPDAYKKQEVKLGADNGKAVQILSGVKAGDHVVTEGAIHVKLASASGAIPAHTHEH